VSNSIGVRLQGLSQKNQALVLCRLAAERSEDGGFTPSELLGFFDLAAIPRPVKISHALAALAKEALISRRTQTGRWWLTPKGRERSNDVFSDLDLQIAITESSPNASAPLGHLAHPLMPPTLAPVEILPALQPFLETYPLDTNVFAMTRFPTDANDRTDPLVQALAAAKEACTAHGMVLHFASDRLIVDDLWGNVLAHMWACRYGIALFEDRADRGVNYNLTIEVGGMLLAGRRTALLKDRTVPAMPTDLVGKIYKAVDLRQPKTIASAVHQWIELDLGLGPCPACGAPTK
jgi:hypothetical protein